MERTRPRARPATIQNKVCITLPIYDEGKFPRFSGVASFSSSLKRLLSVDGYVGRLGSPLGSGARHPPRVEGKHTKSWGQTQKQTVASQNYAGMGKSGVRARGVDESTPKQRVHLSCLQPRLRASQEKTQTPAGWVGADRRAARAQGLFQGRPSRIPWARPARRSGPTGKAFLMRSRELKGQRDKKRLTHPGCFLFCEQLRCTPKQQWC